MIAIALQRKGISYSAFNMIRGRRSEAPTMPEMKKGTVIRCNGF